MEIDIQLIHPNGERKDEAAWNARYGTANHPRKQTPARRNLKDPLAARCPLLVPALE
ncbi:MAG: hypothetical protein ACYC3H_08350 [Bellilinea sp.]